MSDPIKQEIVEVADGVGEFIEYWGFKRVHGRIWTLVYLADKPVDMNYLIENLKLAEGNIKVAIQELLHYHVLVESKVGDSTIYSSNKNISDVVLDVLMNREGQMLNRIRQSVEKLNTLDQNELGSHACSNKVKQLDDMVQTANDVLKSFVVYKQFNFKVLNKALTL